MDEDKQRANDLAAINVGLECHFSASQALTKAVEHLLNHHPYHACKGKRDFKNTVFMILMSMDGGIREMKKNLERDELVFHNGQICINMENRSKRLGNTDPEDEEEEGGGEDAL